MKLNLIPIKTDVTFRLVFKKPLLYLARENERIELTEKIIDNFGIRLNDISFNGNTPSDNFIHFSRYIGGSLIDFSFGLEEYIVRVASPKDEAQLFDILSKCFDLIGKDEIGSQEVFFQRHASTPDNKMDYFKSINFYCPDDFKEIIIGLGYSYTFKFDNENLTIQMNLSDSVLFEGAAYFGLDFLISPSQIDFKEAYSIVKDKHDLIVEKFNIALKEV